MTVAPAARPSPPPPGAARRTRRLAGAVAAAAIALAGCESTPSGERPSMMVQPILGAPSSSVGPGAEGVPSVDLRGHRIASRIGDRFEIRLPGFPSTGHRWVLVDPIPGIVRGVGVARGDAGPGDLAGAPAQEVWRFESAAPGTGTLRFEYRRPSDPPATPPAQRATYRIEIR